MTEFDDTIRNALRDDSEDEVPAMPGLLIDSFRGRSRATTLFAWMKMSGTMAICCVAGALFFVADSARAQLAWATLFVTGFVGFAMWWIWYWMFLNRNVALREIKRLELQIAELRGELSPETHAGAEASTLGEHAPTRVD